MEIKLDNLGCDVLPPMKSVAVIDRTYQLDNDRILS